MIVWDWVPDEFDDAMDRPDSAGIGWRLAAPAPHHAPTVASWSESAAQAEAWVAMALDPFPPRIVAGWWEAPFSTPWVLTDEEGIAAGYGEIWEVGDQLELARLIVDPERRRQGVGRQLVAALLDEARGHGLTACYSRVAPHNVAARGLCQASGFTEVREADAVVWNLDQSVEYVWMRHEAFDPMPRDELARRP